MRAYLPYCVASIIAAFARCWPAHADPTLHRALLETPAATEKPLFTWEHEEDKRGWCYNEGSSVLSIDTLTEDLTAIFRAQLKRLVDADGKQVRLARYNIIYSVTGQRLGIYKDPTSKIIEPLGLMLKPRPPVSEISPNSARDDQTEELMKSADIVTAFRFNAPEDLEHAKSEKVQIGRDGDLQIFLKYRLSIFPHFDGIVDKYLTIFRDSGEDSHLDMATAARSLKWDGLVVLEGVAYNAKDLGNYLWGAAMSRLDVSYGMARLGSEVNGTLFTRYQNLEGYGIIVKGDSDKDQEAIARGYYGIMGKGTGLPEQLEGEFRLKHRKSWKNPGPESPPRKQ